MTSGHAIHRPFDREPIEAGGHGHQAGGLSPASTGGQAGVRRSTDIWSIGDVDQGNWRLGRVLAVGLGEEDWVNGMKDYSDFGKVKGISLKK